MQPEVTDNAVRSHLSSLERDGLIERRGMRPGLRKPHFAYALTTEAEQLFPKAYATLFNQLLAVLKQRIAAQEAETFLSEVTGLEVKEHCRKGKLPQCSFEITENNRIRQVCEFWLENT